LGPDWSGSINAGLTSSREKIVKDGAVGLQASSTFSACGPFWPTPSVKETIWPYFKVLKPDPLMLLK
jgi:hypothetical protein